MKIKNETRTVLHKFVMYVKNQFNQNIQTIPFNNCKQFVYVELYDKFDLLMSYYTNSLQFILI